MLQNGQLFVYLGQEFLPLFTSLKASIVGFCEFFKINSMLLFFSVNTSIGMYPLLLGGLGRLKKAAATELNKQQCFESPESLSSYCAYYLVDSFGT